VARATPPADATIEVSLLGPGFGEAAVIHIGNGEWICVDSCVDANGESIPLAYLRQLGVAPRQVKLVVITHFDDDHIRGASALVRACTKAKVAVSAAFTKKEFLGLVYQTVPRAMMAWPGLREFQRIYDEMTGRGRSGPQFASEDRLLLRRSSKPVVTISALSPSDRAIEAAVAAFTELTPVAGAIRRRLPRIGRNEGSVALWIKIDEVTVLLGADVEASENDHRGWSAVLTAESWRDDPQAEIIKVPHHGGQSGHDDRVWAEMLNQEPVAVLTPWQLLGRELPAQTDRTRICRLTPHAFITAGAASESSASPLILRGMTDAATFVRDAEGTAGHVRARRDLSSSGWRVELFDGAGLMCDPA
jgi:metallo-beta-lactamase superfamily protein